MYVCMYVCNYVCMFVCMYVYMYVCMYVRGCMSVCSFFLIWYSCRQLPGSGGRLPVSAQLAADVAFSIHSSEGGASLVRPYLRIGHVVSSESSRSPCCPHDAVLVTAVDIVHASNASAAIQVHLHSCDTGRSADTWDYIRLSKSQEHIVQ